MAVKLNITDYIYDYVSERLFLKSGPSPSRVYCIFAQLTNSNVLGKVTYPWLEQ
jgi:hypothetical protein